MFRKVEKEAENHYLSITKKDENGKNLIGYISYRSVFRKNHLQKKSCISDSNLFAEPKDANLQTVSIASNFLCETIP
jgi:hypothetical protein